jgi:aminopeptidase
MINTLYEKLAKLVVNYSLNVKKGDRVLIEGPNLAKELFQALFLEVLKAGGHPLVMPQVEGLRELFLKNASEEQLLYLHNFIKLTNTEFDSIISVDGEYNTRHLALIDPKIMAMRQGSSDRTEFMRVFEDRLFKKELKWIGIPFPCNALAQEANMDLFSYSNFVEKALLLDKENPIEEWQKIEKNQARIIENLNIVKHVQVFGEDTELSFSVEGRTWENCCGKVNLPDGEVYTSPVEDSVNGRIRLTYPGIYLGREVKNVYLEFKDGVVINATADKGQDLLEEILKIENANRLGEFAIGTNYGITQFTKNIGFDEKIGGTLHIALGLGLKETGAKNVSAIHWDILKDMKVPGSKIIADDKVIYEEGKWQI